MDRSGFPVLAPLTPADLREMELRLEARLERLEMRITIRLGALIAAGVAFLAAIKVFKH
ncbi:MAG: hypothetical protein H7840_02560 [Alphaproteobacteria bacterium]